jgi:D-cysteine desulfhydrase
VSPTPVEPLPGFGERVWVKRDDLCSPLYGGNKVRRWEWVLGEARAKGIRRLFTVGGLGSTQVVSLAAHGRAAGFAVEALLFDQPDSAFLAEAARSMKGFDAHVERSGGYLRTAARTVARLLASGDAQPPTRALGEGALFVPPGASGPLANLGYVDALLELEAQIDAKLLPRPDAIVLPSGSGGTAAALALTAALVGLRCEVVAVRITERIASNTLTLGAIARATGRLVRARGGPAAPWSLPLRVEHRFAGRGYGHSTPEAERGAARFFEWFGAPGEITYSGKAIAALERLALERPRDTLLLWNTLSTTGRSP